MNASHVIGYLGEVSLEELKSGDHPLCAAGTLSEVRRRTNL